MKDLIDKKVIITDKQSQYYNEWGIIKFFDGEYFYIAIANDIKSLPVFERKQFKIFNEKRIKQ